jgi:hypothetical protein
LAEALLQTEVEAICRKAIAHEQLFQYLNILQPSPEIIDLQMAMMEALFKAKEGNRDQQIKKLILLSLPKRL